MKKKLHRKKLQYITLLMETLIYIFLINNITAFSLSLFPLCKYFKRINENPCKIKLDTFLMRMHSLIIIVKHINHTG